MKTYLEKEFISQFKHQNILVTGANGLIGSELVSELLLANREYNLHLHITALVRDRERALKRFAILPEYNDCTLLIGDVCQKELYVGGKWNYIVHAAGNAHPNAFSTQPVETMKANILGTCNLLEYAKEQENQNAIKKIVFLSTGEVYGETPLPDEKGWREEAAGTVDSIQLRACYPESKRAAETLCKSYFEEYGVPVVVARLSYIYGAFVPEKNSRADAQFLRRAVHGEPIVMKSEGKQLRSYCYVKDAVTAILLLLLKGASGEAYNVANENSVATIREYAETLAHVYGVGIETELATKVEQKGFSKMQREVLNAQKLVQLGWKPNFDLMMGMENMRNRTKEID